MTHSATSRNLFEREASPPGLGEIFAFVAEAVRALRTPTADDAENAFEGVARFFWSVSGPLLTAAAEEQFEALFKAIARARVLSEFDRLTSRPAFKAWLKLAEQQEKVRA